MGGFTVLQLGYGMQGKASLKDILENKSVLKVMVADISDEIWSLPEKINDARVVPVKLNMKDEQLKKQMILSIYCFDLFPKIQGMSHLPSRGIAAK